MSSLSRSRFRHKTDIVSGGSPSISKLYILQTHVLVFILDPPKIEGKTRLSTTHLSLLLLLLYKWQLSGRPKGYIMSSGITLMSQIDALLSYAKMTLVAMCVDVNT